MQKGEYNRRVRKLRERAKTEESKDYGSDFHKEFMLVYDADLKFELANAESVKTMFRLNQRFRYQPLHTFGIYIDL